MNKLVSLLVEHLIPAIIVGLICTWWFDDWRLLVVALLTGWLIDIDHLVDVFYFLLRNGWGAFNKSMLTTGAYFKHNGKVIVPLHSWELALFWALAWYWIGEPGIAVAGSMAWLLHLAYDQHSYRVTTMGYWFVYRLFRGFAHKGFCKE